MKVLICGSRGINPDIEDVVNRAGFEVTEVITGGARGVDKAAELWAKSKGIPCTVYLPDWDQFGKSAGMRRNIEMVLAADAVIAVWDMQSKGTKHSIDYAKKIGKEVRCILPIEPCLIGEKYEIN